MVSSHDHKNFSNFFFLFISYNFFHTDYNGTKKHKYIFWAFWTKLGVFFSSYWFVLCMAFSICKILRKLRLINKRKKLPKNYIYLIVNNFRYRIITKIMIYRSVLEKFWNFLNLAFQEIAWYVKNRYFSKLVKNIKRWK